MLKGDLATAPLPEVLALLADGGASGCLHLRSPNGETARVYLRSGRIYAVLTPGGRPDLGGRLVSRGVLGPEALAEAVEAQHSELQGWRLGELLVHLGFVDQSVVEAFMSEQLRDALTALLSWTSGTWKLRLNERTRDDVAPAATVAELLADVEARRDTWAAIASAVHGPAAVPMLSAAGQSDEQLEIAPDAWSLLCKVDGVRTVAELAGECGLSLYEAGQVVFTLLGAGLLDIEASTPHPDGGDADEPASDEPAETTAESWPVDLAARLTGALTRNASPAPVPAQGSAPIVEELWPEAAAPRHLECAADDEVVSGSILRVSEALSAMLGPATADDDMFSAPLHRPARPAPAAPEDPKKAERSRREAQRRARDAEELAAAQADLEAGRAAEQVRRDDLLPADHVADVVDLQQVRREAEAAEAARLEAVRLEEQARQEAEQARLDAEQARLDEQLRLEEEAWLAAEATENARIAEEARLTQQRLAAEAAEQVRREEAARRAEAAAEAEAVAAAAEELRRQQDSWFAAASREQFEPEPEPEPQWWSAETHAAALAELSASASLDVAPPAPTPVPVDVAGDPTDGDAADDDDEPMRVYGNPDTDTASLLRELSSLGLDDEAPPATVSRPARPAASRPASLAAQKKRKGLFGRG